MRAIALFSALVLGALTLPVLAEEMITLTDGQMDKVTAGAQTYQPVFSTTRGAKTGQNLFVAQPAAERGNFASAIEHSPILVPPH